VITPYSSQELRQTLALVDELAAPSDARDTTALVFRLDQWLTFDQPIALREGEFYPESGCLLSSGGEWGEQLWLLKGGRTLRVPASGDASVEESLLAAEAGVQPVTEALRRLALLQYLGGGFDGVSSVTVPVVVRDLFEIVPHLAPGSRLAVMGSLADGMRAGDGWDTAAARLRAGFERGLSDHSSDVMAVCVRALVRLAAGRGPTPPAGDPRRGVLVLMVNPRSEVHRAALAAMRDLPRAALDGLIDVSRRYLDAFLADPDLEIRELAAEILRRTSGGDAVSELADAIASGDADRRTSALAALVGLPDDRLCLLLASAMGALADIDADVRSASAATLEAAVQRPSLRRQTLVGLLTSQHEPAVILGLTHLAPADAAAGSTLRGALEAVLTGSMERARVPAAEILADRYGEAELPEAIEGFESLVRCSDPEVRRVALRRLARYARERTQVREALFPLLREHLDDPHPELRVEAALTLVEMDYPHAATIAAQLAYDSDPVVRTSLPHVISRSGDKQACANVVRLVAHIDVLFDFASSGSGDDRLRWKAALDAVTAESSPRLPRLLAALLGSAPDDASDPFLQFAVDEIDHRLLDLVEDGHDLVSLCRHLVLPPNRHARHAARLAAARAAADPFAFDFLWTLYAAGEGADREIARRALAAVAPLKKSAEVQDAIAETARTSRNQFERDLLHTMLTGGANG